MDDALLTTTMVDRLRMENAFILDSVSVFAELDEPDTFSNAAGFHGSFFYSNVAIQNA